MLWILILLAIAVAISFYVHSAADRARASSEHGDQPALIVSLPLAGRFPSPEERRILYGVGDDIQARNAAALIDVGVRKRRMYLRLAAADVEAAVASLNEVLAARGVAGVATIERVAATSAHAHQ